ncbi:MAG TPA: type II toxin-antitoxin system Phd/YefM family antitoxin [Rhodocyclaceae bacterium]|nr:type II toxin-antitoxin system Phd/YefM family antitoxin [Rhodocyclaceae bacterium]
MGGKKWHAIVTFRHASGKPAAGLANQTPSNHNDHYDQYGIAAMITETNAVTFRQNLGEMLNQVQYRHDSVVINKDGKPVAALVDARLFERIRRMQGRFDALCQRIEAGFAATPEDEGLAEIEAAVAAERAAPR